MQTINITAYTEDVSQLETLKAIMKALKIKFRINTKDVYSEEFVNKIIESKKQIVEGKFTEVKADNIKTFIDSL